MPLFSWIWSLASFVKGWKTHSTREVKAQTYKRRGVAQGLAFQNERDHMEDRAATRLPHMLAVFDGHGGSECSQYMSTTFVNDLYHQVKCYMHQPYSVFRRLLLEDFKRGTRLMQLYRDRFASCGSTAVFCFHRPLRKELVLVNVGDSRGIVVDVETGTVLHSTRDHKPTDPNERKLIREHGGIVFASRINGILAVGRAFGDYNCTGIHATPDVSVCVYGSSKKRKAQKEQKETKPKNIVLVLATDGIWDALSNRDVAVIVKTHWTKDKHDKQDDWMKAALQEIQDTAIRRGSRDNTTVWLWNV